MNLFHKATNRLEKSKAGKKDDSKKTTGDESAKQQATSGPSLETASLEDLKAEVSVVLEFIFDVRKRTHRPHLQTVQSVLA